jgi:hypothetical protein
MAYLWLPVLPFAVFFAWLFRFGMRRGKRCPDCGDRLPIIQAPFKKTKRQWIEGGYLCPSCSCEVDIAGRKVPAGTGPRAKLLMIGIALLVLAVIPSAILLTLILQ